MLNKEDIIEYLLVPLFGVLTAVMISLTWLGEGDDKVSMFEGLWFLAVFVAYSIEVGYKKYLKVGRVSYFVVVFIMPLSWSCFALIMALVGT